MAKDEAIETILPLPTKIFKEFPFMIMNVTTLPKRLCLVESHTGQLRTLFELEQPGEDSHKI